MLSKANKEKITYIDRRKDFNSLPKDFSELEELVKENRLDSVFIAFRYREDGEFRIGYMWRGAESVTKELGLIEYIKLFLYEKNCITV